MACARKSKKRPTISKPWGLAAKVTEPLISASLARQAPNKTHSCDLVQVAGECIAKVTSDLQKVGILKSVDMAKVKEQFAKRETTDVFAEDKFEECMKLYADVFNVRD